MNKINSSFIIYNLPLDCVYCANNPVMLVDPDGCETVCNQYGEIIQNDVFDPEDPSIYLYIGDQTKLIGSFGSKVDATFIINNILIRTINFTINENMTGFNLGTFKKKVQSNGDWDFKTNKKTIFGVGNLVAGTTFKYYSKSMSSQDFGNFHYGFAGASFGINSKLLLRAAGFAQVHLDHTSKPEWQNWGGLNLKTPYGDKPNDQYWIKEGIKWFEN